MSSNLLITTKKFEEQKDFWLNQLSGELNEVKMFTDFPRTKDYEIRKCEIALEQNLAKKLIAISKNKDLSLYVILLTALKILLYKVTNQNDIIVSSPVYGTQVLDYNKYILFRDLLNSELTFRDLLMNMQKTVANGYKNQHYPFRKLIEFLNIKNSDSLFRVVLLLENIHQKDIANEIIENFSNDLTFSIQRIDEDIKGEIIYNSKLYKEETIEKLFDCYQYVLNQVLENTKIGIKEIQLVKEEEKNKVLNEFNNTKCLYPIEKKLQDLFEEQVDRNPNQIAVTLGNDHLTYTELNAKANQLARLLRVKGVHADTIVGLLVERSIEMVIGILGILKAGGAYLPIDPTYPINRIQYMLEDSGASILLTKKFLLDRVNFKREIVDLEDEKVYQNAGTNLPSINTSNDLAYVIYTSGSTGKPKGVMIEHKGIVNFVIWRMRTYGCSSTDVTLQLLTIAFDAFGGSFYSCILSGGKLVLVNDDQWKDYNYIRKLIEKEKVTIIGTVPSIYKVILYGAEKEELKTVRHVVVGGEKTDHDLLQLSKKINSGITMVNEYGPTENSVTTTVCPEITFENLSSIGKPIANNIVFILNKQNELMPIGLPGELCVSGVGLARGYLNQAELTEQKFTLNPYRNSDAIMDEKLYNTGDVARWLPDGTLEFFGREDAQVKIRGYRIELGEVEYGVQTYEAIREVVVIVKEDVKGDQHLCAYFTAMIDVNENDLRESLTRELPDYMIPSYFIQIDEIPLTPNGKVDRNALELMAITTSLEAEYVAPENETEEILVQMWQEILGRDKIGVRDNFFTLGGHSLKATILKSKISKELNAEVTVSEIFEYPTIKAIAEIVNRKEKSLFSAIKTAGLQAYYPLSSEQKRIFLLGQLSEHSTTYNMPTIVGLQGHINIHQFERAYQLLVERHESLRTGFEMFEGKPVQKIYEKIDTHIEYVKASEEDVQEIIKNSICPFDLSKAPLCRVKLIELSETNYVLLVDMHHIISDGVSVGIIIDEFLRLYKGETLPQNLLHYKDYAVWQRELVETDEFKRQEKYWLNQFAGDIPVLNLPTDFVRPIIQSFAGNNVSFRVEKDIMDQLYDLAHKNGASLYMVLLAAYNSILYRYTGQCDIIIGSPIAGRPHVNLEKIVGMFVNTLAMRNKPAGDKTFIEFLIEVKENALMAFENQIYQFEDLVEKLNLNRDMSRNPIFDTMFTLQNVDFTDLDFDQIKVVPYKFKNTTSKFDLSLTASEGENALYFSIEYCTKLFKEETIQRFSQHFCRFLESVAKNSAVKLKDIDILSEAEKTQLVFEFNDTQVEYPQDKTISSIFEERVTKTPENIAVIFKDKQLTYKELNDKANLVARLLRSKGVGSDTIVGIMVERSLEMMIGIMGILKAGGAYLPIDPDYPEDRMEYMLEDSSCQLLLTQEHLQNRVVFVDEIINLNDSNIYIGDNSNLPRINSSVDLAYIIYTSGSTGKPKGVLIEQRSLINQLNWIQSINNYDENDIILQKTTFTFDASVQQLFSGIFGGAKVCLLIPGGEKDLEVIIESIEKYKVTSIGFVPSMLKVFFEYLKQGVDLQRLVSLRQFVVGGEALQPHHIEKFTYLFKDFHVKLYNLYGQTETTIQVTFYECSSCGEKQEFIPIGKPIDNTRIYILNEYNNLQPIGVPGELCIAGANLARGYLNRLELTQEKFVDDPFYPGEKMYKTGDIAQWMPDGVLKYMGRVDQQVKIRGYRIELGEIEYQLLKHPCVKDSVVLDVEDIDNANNKYLCAYLALEREVTVTELKDYLAKKLPDYMIPSYFIILEKLPLTSNEKIDRKKLLEYDPIACGHGRFDMGEKYVAATCEVEERLAMLWSETLGIDKIGIYDNFFSLGGHSLRAISLVSEVFKEMNVEISLVEFFKNPTIKGMANYLNSSRSSIYESIEPENKREYYPLSSEQKRLFILNQFEGENGSYNMPSVIVLKGDIERNKLAGVFYELIARHEILRTSFDLIDGYPVQKIHEDVEFELVYLEAKENEVKEIIKDFLKPFDLSIAPLLRVGFIKLEEKKHLLIFNMHHIISDGVSSAIITAEFLKLYSGELLQPLRIQYKDYAVWQQKKLKSEDFKEQERYWLKQLEGEISVLNLPTDYSRPPLQSFEGDTISFKIGEELTNHLYSIARENRATLYITLLAAYNTILYKYTGQEDIVVGSINAGRTHSDLRKMIGLFIKTLAIRNQPEGSKTFIELLLEVKENALNAYDNQDYPFEELVEKLDIRRDLSRNPLFDTVFMLQNMEHVDLSIPEIELEPYQFSGHTSKFDLCMVAAEVGNELYFTFEYCTKLFKKETIERLGKHFTLLLEEIVKNPQVKLNEIKILSEQERKQVLFDFNVTRIEFAEDKMIHELFEEQVAKTPDNVVAVFAGQQITYLELNEKANQLARELRENGVKADQIVAVMIERSIEMLTGILAILKAGGAYLPIDLNYPEERINYMLTDSKVEVVLTLRNLFDQYCGIEFNGKVIDVSGKKTFNKMNLDQTATSSNLCYVIYTSGSTGQPKGVMIEHKNVVNFIKGITDQIEFLPGKAILALTTISFDIFVLETLLPLTKGLKVIIAGEEDQSDPELLGEIIIKENVSILQATPSRLKLFVNNKEHLLSLQGIETLIVGGEAFPESLHQMIKNELKVKVYNVYGPTETTVWSTVKDVTMDEKINIGKPIANTQILILDRYNNPQPIGVPGELCIAGKGVARGYLNKPELTKEKFVELSLTMHRDGVFAGMMYKTGDVAKWLPDGNIEFLGRIDHQVKIRGFRIELEEIDNQLMTHPDIKEAVVIAKEDQRFGQYLNAFIVIEKELTISELRGHLVRKLPDYMIPAYFTYLDQLPLTLNGKIDRRVLQESEETVLAGTEYVAPGNEVEEKLAEIWKDVLEVDRVGVNDNFFVLGGNSLKILSVLVKMKQEFEVEGLRSVDLYKYATIKQIADLISKGISRKNDLLIDLIEDMTEKEVSIICVPYAGGDAAAFQPFATEISRLSSKIGVYAIEMPEYDFSNGQVEVSSMQTVVSECVEEIRGNIHTSVVMYGHCSGGELALEITRTLEDLGVEVKCAIMGAHLPSSKKEMPLPKRNSQSFKSDQGIYDLLSSVGAFQGEIPEEQLRRIINNFRRDLKMIEERNHENINEKLRLINAPLYNIIADKDVLTRGYKKRHKGWKKYSNKISLIVVESFSHYFISENAPSVSKIIYDLIRD